MEKDQNILPERKIRSFVRRSGRITALQKNALEQFAEKYELKTTGEPFDFNAIFDNNNPVVVEIGFGNGVSLAQMAQENPDENFFGIEVHRPGIGKLMALADEFGLHNLRVIEADAVDILEKNIQPDSLKRLQLYFPDPWPKKRHHKRRIVSPEWVELVAKRLKPGGVLHMATDWQNYAEQMLEVMSASALYKNSAGENQYASRPNYRPKTKFEKRGERLGHGVWDLIFKKV
ncbi:MAG: tRNA (guanosine(46)-N7)-methyltransferase TrmB [Gammaproteobacteria bacterium]|nr:MAG: tRNA (guanosine(46)-N7)-methyltransferase TrmB [Gammaproteobacteria bacterium]